MVGLVPGRIVHWVSGKHYPAMVIEVLDGRKASGLCVLRIFGQYSVDDERVEAIYDEHFLNGTWHWIERE